MKQVNKLALSPVPLVFLALCGGVTFAITCVYEFFNPDTNTICWEAGILSAVSYGFIMIHTNQLNIHSDKNEN